MNELRGQRSRANRRHPIVEKSALVGLVAMLVLPVCVSAQTPTRKIPGILSVRDRATIVTEITRKRLDTRRPARDESVA